MLNNLGNVVRSQGSYTEARNLYAESLTVYRELGDGWATAYLLEDVARLLHLQNENSDALVLICAASSLRERIDASLPPSDQKALDDLQDRIKNELGQGLTAECKGSGSAMSMNEAVAFALNSVN